MTTQDPSALDSLSRPVLSLILCSRNDQYQGNSIWRLETALNYVAQSVEELGRNGEVEILVADWGSETCLDGVLHLTPLSQKIVSFVHIPPDVARGEQKDSPFPEVLALNAAVRRAKGEYIGRIDQDTLVGIYFLKTFFWLYEKRRLLVPLDSAVMLSNRRRIPYRFAVCCPSFWVVDRFIRCFGRFLPLMEPQPPHLYYQSYIGVLLLHRNLWKVCGAYDEQFIYMDFMEFDIILRLTSKYPFINLGELVNHDFYHLDHGHPREPWSASRNRKVNPVRNLDNPPEEFHPNSENWGLVDHNLTVLPASRPCEIGRMRPVCRFQSNWLAFTYLLVFSGLQIFWDNLLLVTILPARRLVRSSAAVWTRRAQIVWETIAGAPIVTWPRLLMNRWSKRSSS